MARQRRSRSTESGTHVRVQGNKVIIQVASADLNHALDCLENNGKIEFTFGELRVRQFPTDMIFEPRSGFSTQPVEPTFDGGDGGGHDGGSDGGGHDID